MIIKCHDIDGQILLLNSNEIESVVELGGGFHHGARSTVRMKSGEIHSIREESEALFQNMVAAEVMRR